MSEPCAIAYAPGVTADDLREIIAWMAALRDGSDEGMIDATLWIQSLKRDQN